MLVAHVNACPEDLREKGSLHGSGRGLRSSDEKDHHTIGDDENRDEEKKAMGIR